MIRFFTDYLIDWKNRSHRKPLMVRGARQVGKTYTIEEFGTGHFSNVIKLNFEETPELQQFFNTNDVEQIIRNLELYFGEKIRGTDTLFFLDEIQSCPEAIVTLRYFYEKFPDLHVIAAGSLLDHTLNDLQYSMPVGRIEFAYMYPLNFYEFLIEVEDRSLVEFLRNYSMEDEIPLPLHNKLLRLVRLYSMVGGMPEAVKIYTETKSLIDTARVHESIIRSLEFDFSKYGTRTQQHTMVKLLKYLPRATGWKFKYSNFDHSIRSDAIRRALVLLSMSRIIHIVHNTKATGIPLESGVTEKTFKTLFMDVGLSNHILKTPAADPEFLDLVHEGNLAEQYIGQELLCLPPWFSEQGVYYWMREKRNAEAEIDYLIQSGNQILPIEVKAGKTGTLKSLQVFMAERRLDMAIRFNSDLPSITQVKTSVRMGGSMQSVDFELISLPLYLVQELDRLAK